MRLQDIRLIYKSTAFLCTNKEQLEFEIKNDAIYISTKKILRYKSNKNTISITR